MKPPALGREPDWAKVVVVDKRNERRREMMGVCDDVCEVSERNRQPENFGVDQKKMGASEGRERFGLRGITRGSPFILIFLNLLWLALFDVVLQLLI